MKITQLVLTEEEQHSQLMEHMISEILGMSVRSHFWHWQTKSYAAHQAFGKFYEKMTELVDQLAEQFMGTGGEFKASVDMNMTPFEMENAVETLNKFKEQLIDAETVLMKDENAPYHGCADTLIDVIKEVDQLKYLLTLE